MKWLVGILLLLAAVIGVLIAINEFSQVDARAKAETVRRALEPVTTEAEFERVAVANGLTCRAELVPAATTKSAVRRIWCSWFETHPPYDLLGQFDFIQSAVFADGTFTDGVKSDAYNVEDSYTGP